MNAFNNVGKQTLCMMERRGQNNERLKEQAVKSFISLYPLDLSCSLFSYLPRGKVLMWGIGSKGSSWKWGCEASYKGREQWLSSWALQGWSHAVAHAIAPALHSPGVNWPHFFTGQATWGQELKVKCWRSLMTLARVSWWQQEDFHLKRFTVESAQGKTGTYFFWWQLWYEILLKFFFPP